MSEVKIFPLGLDALTVEFGNEISERYNRRAVGLSRYFEKNSFAGMIETVPAYASVSIFYDFYAVRKNFPEFPTAFETVKSLAEKALENMPEDNQTKSRLIEIPADFSEEFAPDLRFVAESNNITAPEVVKIFTARTYRVFMLGFLPGFAYLGEVDERIETPRHASPRLQVPKGSIGIAGRQTGVYPLVSPGGWQIIGRTNLEMFDLNRKNPCLLQTGDTVRFYEHSS